MFAYQLGFIHFFEKPSSKAIFVLSSLASNKNIFFMFCDYAALGAS